MNQSKSKIEWALEIIIVLAIIFMVWSIYDTGHDTEKYDLIFEQEQRTQILLDSIITRLNSDIVKIDSVIERRYYTIKYIERETDEIAQEHFNIADSNVYREYIGLLSILKNRFDTSKHRGSSLD